MTAKAMKHDINEQYGTVIAPATLRLQRLLPGPAERVWSYLTEADKSAQWFAAVESSFQPGAPLTLSFDHSKITPHDEVVPEEYKEASCGVVGGKVLRCEPPKVLSYEWGSDSFVTFELEPQGDKVLLTLTHSKLRDRTQMLSVASGWHAHVDILIAKLSGETPNPFWAAHTRLKLEYEKLI